MSILSVSTFPKSRGGSMNHLWQRTYRQRWRVITSAPTVGVKAVRTAIDPNDATVKIPAIGNSYATTTESDTGSFVQSLDVDEEGEDGCSWVVTAEYGPYDANAFPIDPTQWAIRVTQTGSRVERVIWLDQAGNPIRNTAGDPFADPVTIDDSRSQLTIVRNELVSAFSLTLAETFRDTLNDAVWNGFAAKTVKCGIITTSDPQYDTNANVWYYSVTYPFEVNRDGWARKLLDQGYAVLDGSGKLKKLTGSDGQALDEPALLDGSGHELASGGTPVTLTFDVYPAVDWSGLNLDLSTRLGA